MNLRDFPKIEKSNHSSRKAHLWAFLYELSAIIEALFFLVTLGFYDIPLRRWILGFEWDDDDE